MRALLILLVVIAPARGQVRTFSAPFDGFLDHVRGGGGCVVLLREADELNQDVARAMGLSGAIRVTGREGTVKPHGAPHPVSAMVPASGWKGTCAGVPRAAPIDGRVLLAEGDRAVCWVREHGGVRVAVMADLSRPHDAVGAVQRSAATAWAGRTKAAERPADAEVLFDGESTVAWRPEKKGGPVPWEIVDGTLQVTPGKGSIMTRKPYGDFRLYAEFNVPEGKGNSGFYLQRRYEVQVLNTAGREPKPNFCGALYRYRKPDVNAALPAGVWQTYDITFRQPRWKDGKKVANARITVVHNGITVHDDVELTRKTGAGKQEGPESMPLLLQDHGWKIRFRDIWIQPLSP